MNKFLNQVTSLPTKNSMGIYKTHSNRSIRQPSQSKHRPLLQQFVPSGNLFNLVSLSSPDFGWPRALPHVVARLSMRTKLLTGYLYYPNSTSLLCSSTAALTFARTCPKCRLELCGDGRSPRSHPAKRGLPRQFSSMARHRTEGEGKGDV